MKRHIYARKDSHGIRCPLEGSRIADLWIYADELTEGSTPAPRKAVIKYGTDILGLSPNTASMQYAQWRKFHFGPKRVPKEEES